MKIIKRDGTEEQFDIRKIIDALTKAFKSCGKEFNMNNTNTYELVSYIDRDLNGYTVLHVKEVHTIVEIGLEEFLLDDVLKQYKSYRQERDKNREKSGILYQTINEFLNQSNPDITQENANKDASVVSTHRDLLAGLLSKHYAMEHILPKDLAKLHEEGYIHIHDLDYLISPLTNCCLINYPDMLEKGFKIGNAKIEQPKSISVATTVLTQIIQAVSSSQYGGQSVAHIDKYLVPYAQKSYEKYVDEAKLYNIHLPAVYAWEKTKKEIYDAMQTFFYQVNSITSTNG